MTQQPQKRLKRSPGVRLLDLPADCFAEISSFFFVFRDLEGLLFSCKLLYNLFKSPNFFSCENIHFSFTYNKVLFGKNSYFFSFVRSLSFREVREYYRYMLGKHGKRNINVLFKQLSHIIQTKFPHLQEMHMVHNKPIEMYNYKNINSECNMIGLKWKDFSYDFNDKKIIKKIVLKYSLEHSFEQNISSINVNDLYGNVLFPHVEEFHIIYYSNINNHEYPYIYKCDFLNIFPKLQKVKFEKCVLPQSFISLLPSSLLSLSLIDCKFAFKNENKNENKIENKIEINVKNLEIRHFKCDVNDILKNIKNVERFVYIFSYKKKLKGLCEFLRKLKSLKELQINQMNINDEKWRIESEWAIDFDKLKSLKLCCNKKRKFYEMKLRKCKEENCYYYHFYCNSCDKCDQCMKEYPCKEEFPCSGCEQKHSMKYKNPQKYFIARKCCGIQCHHTCKRSFCRTCYRSAKFIREIMCDEYCELCCYDCYWECEICDEMNYEQKINNENICDECRFNTTCQNCSKYIFSDEQQQCTECEKNIFCEECKDIPFPIKVKDKTLMMNLECSICGYMMCLKCKSESQKCSNCVT